MIAHVLSIALGLALGAAAGLAHLGACRLRARLAVEGRPLLALVTYPLSLAPAALAVVACARVAPLAAWAVLGGVFLARAAVLGRRKEAAR